MKYFRYLSMIEGLSLLTLLFIAMPMRYYAGIHDAVWYVGWTHGILFLLYGAGALVTSHQQGWSILYWLFIFFMGAVPFGFLLVDHQLRKAMEATEVSTGVEAALEGEH